MKKAILASLDHVGNKVFWDKIKNSGTRVKQGEIYVPLTPDVVFGQRENYLSFARQYRIKPLSMKSVGLLYREAYRDLFVMFINCVAGDLVEGIERGTVNKTLLFELEALEERPTQRRILGWFETFLRLDSQTKNVVVEDKRSDLFWSYHVRFSKEDRVDKKESVARPETIKMRLHKLYTETHGENMTRREFTAYVKKMCPDLTKSQISSAIDRVKKLRTISFKPKPLS